MRANSSSSVLFATTITGCLAANSFANAQLKIESNLFLDKKLCNNCLSPGHFASNCTKDKFCKVEGCTTKHSSFLHLKPTKSATTNAVHLEQAGQSASSSIDNQHSAQNGFVSLSTQSTVIPVTSLAMVPVRVRVPGQRQVVENLCLSG